MELCTSICFFFIYILQFVESENIIGNFTNVTLKHMNLNLLETHPNSIHWADISTKMYGNVISYLSIYLLMSRKLVRLINNQQKLTTNKSIFFF